MPDNRIPTNQSQLDINTSIQAINTQIQALNTLIGSLGLVTITPISQDDYDALSQAEKLAGVFDIYDAVEPDIDGNKVLYSSSPKKTVIDVIPKYKDVSYSNLSNSDSTLYNIVVSGNILNDIGDNASQVLSATIINFSGFSNQSDKILPNIEIDTNRLFTCFKKGNTFSNINYTVRYLYI